VNIDLSGKGALVTGAGRSAFEGNPPDMVGGGTVLFVSEEEEMWSGPPDSEEAGSPNVVGAIAMAAATRFLESDLGWEWVIRHERELTSYALARLNEIPGMTIYGPNDPSLAEDRLGVIAFNLENRDHQLTAAVLSHEYAIGTRTGGFCAHPYLMRLFGVSHERVHQLRDEVSCGDRRGMPGAVRISFGCYTTREDVDAAVGALWAIQRGEWQGDYLQNPKSGEYKPIETKSDPAGWFNL
jgi:selenocysteine lyase/cysteine desulfurase